MCEIRNARPCTACAATQGISEWPPASVRRWGAVERESNRPSTRVKRWGAAERESNISRLQVRRDNRTDNGIIEVRRDNRKREQQVICK